ncbi:MAG: hypothetical protein M3Q07_17055 [Pseudobdellovibrionaceae bacterium]|nr:hypothetical protein [Pseudobdellovibrionaceae bacterium]
MFFKIFKSRTTSRNLSGMSASDLLGKSAFMIAAALTSVSAIAVAQSIDSNSAELLPSDTTGQGTKLTCFGIGDQPLRVLRVAGATRGDRRPSFGDILSSFGVRASIEDPQDSSSNLFVRGTSVPGQVAFIERNGGQAVLSFGFLFPNLIENHLARTPDRGANFIEFSRHQSGTSPNLGLAAKRDALVGSEEYNAIASSIFGIENSSAATSSPFFYVFLNESTGYTEGQGRLIKPKGFLSASQIERTQGRAIFEAPVIANFRCRVNKLK